MAPRKQPEPEPEPVVIQEHWFDFDFEYLCWLVFGVAALLGIVWLILGFSQDSTERQADRQRTERTRIEACSTIEPEELKAFCINGIDADINVYNGAGR